ncbi:hypothetical protein HRbin36_01348 [bacterium HR36]|nr:hypothetical protein HRbin36_01348 [bacterium HR36]
MRSFPIWRQLAVELCPLLRRIARFFSASCDLANHLFVTQLVTESRAQLSLLLRIAPFGMKQVYAKEGLVLPCKAEGFAGAVSLGEEPAAINPWVAWASLERVLAE